MPTLTVSSSAVVAGKSLRTSAKTFKCHLSARPHVGPPLSLLLLLFCFLCVVCVSSDGVICDEVRVSESGGGGLSAGAIAAIVIITIIIICIAGKMQEISSCIWVFCTVFSVVMETVVLTILVLLWKFKNDAFHNYICPCVGRGSKRAMLSLQQENQRLRQELNQTKINTSNRFTAGQFGESFHLPPPFLFLTIFIY